MQKIQGFVEAGNTTLSITGAAGTIVRKVQGSFPSATVTVYVAGTVTIASIYSDNDLTPKANPFVASANGTWFFYGANGQFDVKFSGGTLSAPFTLGALGSIDEGVIWADVTASPYFAKADGTTNDTTAIQAALDAVSPGGTCYLPPGTYKCTSQLTMAGRKVNMIGAGRDATILYFPNTGVDGIIAATNCRYAHFTLRGPNSGSSGIGFDTGGITDATFEDLVVEQWSSHGINTGGSSARLYFLNCIIRNNFFDGVLFGGGTTDCIMESCYVYGNIFNGVDINGSRNQILGCHVYSNGSTGGPVDRNGILVQAIASGAVPSDADYNIISNCLVYSNGGQGITIRSDIAYTANYNKIIGNTCFSNSGTSVNGDGIIIDGSAPGGTMSGNSIIGNTCYLNQRSGILLDATNCTVSNTIISDNQVVSNTTFGVAMATNVTDTQVIGNTILLNGTQILDNGTRTVKLGNKIQTGDGNLEIVASNLETGSTFTSGLMVKSTGNTELRLTSSGAGRRVYTHAISGTGDYSIIDLTGGSNLRLKIDSSGIVYTPVGLNIGGGATIQQVIGSAATLDFPSTAAQTSSDLTTALTGARTGYPVIVSPSSGVWASSGYGFYVAQCTSADVITVRFVNPTAGAIDPPSGVFVFIQMRI